LPDWNEGMIPADHEPGVRIDGASIGERDGEPCLSIKVSLFYLDEIEGNDAD
jgi:hypothetical protein